MTGFFSGIATAMITPFNKNGVNLDEFGKMIEYQIDGGTNRRRYQRTRLYRHYGRACDYDGRRKDGSYKVFR